MFFNPHFWRPLIRHRFGKVTVYLLRFRFLHRLHQRYFQRLAQSCADRAHRHRQGVYAHRRPLLQGAPAQPPLNQAPPRPRPYRLKNPTCRLWRASSLGAFKSQRYQGSFKSR